MNLSRAISLASDWSKGYVCSLRDGEAREYHKLCCKALRMMREQRALESHSKALESFGCSACDGGFGDNTLKYAEWGYKFCPYCGRRLEEV